MSRRVERPHVLPCSCWQILQSGTLLEYLHMEANLMTGTRLWSMLVAAALLLAIALPAGQTLGEKERFTAIAIVNNNRASGSGIVQIDINRWSTAAEREALLNTLKKQGAQKLLDALQGTKPVGIIK